MNNCPCCSSRLLHHIRQGETYWFCSRCRQEMPNSKQKIMTISQTICTTKSSIGISPAVVLRG